MAEFGGALDAWLEAPYVERAKREAAFEDWCEATGTDPELEGSWDAFESAMDDYDADVPEPPDDWDVDPRDLV